MMPCFLVKELVDNCSQVVESTEDLGDLTTLYTGVTCPGGWSLPNCTNTSVTPPGLTIDCIVTPVVSIVGWSPDNLNPALTNVWFQLSYTKSVTITEPGNPSVSCTSRTRGPFVRNIMVQLTTSTPSLPLNYDYILDSSACVCKLIHDDSDEDSCHVVCQQKFCLEFISWHWVKQEIASTPCTTTSCDPLPPLVCPPA